MYRKMVEIRQFEDTVYFMFLEGKLPGTVHLYQGQEAIAAGICANLKKEDVITSTHRADGHALAKGVSIKSCMAEFFGRITGCCKGKGGSMHLGDISAGMVPAIAIVGGGIPVATGCALAFTFQKKNNVAVSFFGDGATNEGVWHESLNMASIWNLPVIYVCENNLYGASTHITKIMKVKNVIDRICSYGISAEIVDGNDFIEVYTVAKKAVERAKKGEGPTFIECKTYRRTGHSRGDSNAYRDKEEEKLWMTKDPVLIAQNKLKEMKILGDDDFKKIDEEVKKKIEEAIEFTENSPFPEPEDTLRDLWV
ncbi:MAG: thiamine pyrophosphate-dependent dehydrogenase E1 component subunit alpha [Candidatus Omnitrophica bacterium]|nr:thiamine pyrophosphate-dependent dehydrogenase E1 component subunit alpha [Candidatus Omnitrophota bacterium]